MKVIFNIFFSIVVDVVNACGGEDDGVSTINYSGLLHNRVRFTIIQIYILLSFINTKKQK